MTLNRGDTFTFDVNGTYDQARQRVTVGCQGAALTAVVANADKVEVEGTTVRITGLKGTYGPSGVTIEGLYGVLVSRIDLESRARNIKVTTPSAPAWQDGDVIVTTARAALSSDTPGGARMRVLGEWVRPNGTRLRRKDSDGYYHADVDARVSSDLAKGRYTVLRRGGQGPIKVGDRVRVSDPAGTRADGSGYVSENAYGQEAVVLRPSAAIANGWTVEGVGRNGRSFSQHVHENSLTKI